MICPRRCPLPSHGIGDRRRNGIGRACALTLSAWGAKVYVLGRTEASLLEQTQSMAAPGSIETVVADVRESDQVDDALQRIWRKARWTFW